MVYVNRELDYAIQFVIAIAQKQGKPMSIQSFSKESAISPTIKKSPFET